MASTKIYNFMKVLYLDIVASQIKLQEEPQEHGNGDGQVKESFVSDAEKQEGAEECCSHG